MATINYPAGAQGAFEMTATGTQAFTIVNQHTLIDGETVEATGNRTLNLTLDGELREGATILITNQTNGTETLTHGTSIIAPVVTGSAGKTTSQGFRLSGTNFTPDGAKIQVD